MILTQQVLDYNKHCKIPIGQDVQANHETMKTSSNIARILDCIYLRPTSNIQGGHELMDLSTGWVITCSVIAPIPVTQMIIETVEKMAEDQGFKKLKFKNRYGKIYPDADWLAGVDNGDKKQE